MIRWFMSSPGLLPAVVSILFTLPLSANQVAGPQASEEQVFQQAVNAYQGNAFRRARVLFESIHGPRGQDAKSYLDKIGKYEEAIEIGNSELSRSPDEQDVHSMDIAIQEFEEALEIKPDGIGNPKGQLERARALKVQLLDKADVTNRKLCQKALDDANSHKYEEAAALSCLLKNDNPEYACNGREAARLCEQMQDLAKAGKTQTAHSGQLVEQSAVSDLERGIKEFYSGEYDLAEADLEAYGQKSGDNVPLARFYIGASKAAQFFLSGSTDRKMREAALLDFRFCKDAGFVADDREISPRILRVYERLTF